jgi:hypothetical protein
VRKYGEKLQRASEKSAAPGPARRRVILKRNHPVPVPASARSVSAERMGRMGSLLKRR